MKLIVPIHMMSSEDVVTKPTGKKEYAVVHSIGAMSRNNDSTVAMVYLDESLEGKIMGLRDTQKGTINLVSRDFLVAVHDQSVIKAVVEEQL